MKRFTWIISFSILAIVSCSKNEKNVEISSVVVSEEKQAVVLTPEEEGKVLVEGADCLTCHKMDAQLIGPSYQEVAKKYTEKEVDMLADKIINGGVGVWGDVPMSQHPGLDKENAKKMVKYILAQKK